MTRHGQWVVALSLMLMAAGAAGQEPDRAAELRTRQAERLEQHQLRRGDPAWPLEYRGGPTRDCYPGAPGRGTLTPWGSGPWSGSPWSGSPWSGGIDRRRPASPCPPYAGTPRLDHLYGYGLGSYAHPYAYPAPPNPYRDWARLWGRGWLDGAAVPPYHRFQYRFFPETLPDPTREGYVAPGEWYGGARPPVVVQPGRSCARLELVLGEDASETVMVALPALGATTVEALRAVITDRLRRGAGVTLRDLDGYVVRLPPAERLQDLILGPCR